MYNCFQKFFNSWDHFWGQNELWPKKYVKLGLVFWEKIWNIKGVPQKEKK